MFFTFALSGRSVCKYMSYIGSYIFYIFIAFAHNHSIKITCKNSDYILNINNKNSR